MRKNIVAGNWKMNKTFVEADDLIHNIAEDIKANGSPEKADVVICVPSIYLELATDVAEDVPVLVGAQNVSQYENGAYTGEISAEMLESMAVDYCIIGHSERRKYFNETDSELAVKVDRLLERNINPIFCCGEQLEEREAGNHFNVVRSQIEQAIFHIEPKQIRKVVIAYEPVWAIGTGMTASPEQAEEMHAFIRNLLKEKYGDIIAEEISILYGGSCNPKNAAELFANPDVDGGLIGGASLNSDDFMSIARSF